LRSRLPRRCYRTIIGPKGVFSTTALSWNDWLACVAVALSVLWLRELTKLVK